MFLEKVGKFLILVKERECNKFLVFDDFYEVELECKGLFRFFMKK